MLRFLSSVFIVQVAIFATCNSQGHYENVAFNKTCQMSSKMDSENNEKNAVNGNTGGIYSPTVNCIHTDVGYQNVWWEVDLGRPYPVSSITVWAREGHVDRMSNSVITVDGKACYTFVTVPYNFNRKIPISCSSGIVNGRVVRVSRTSSAALAIQNVLNFCEFEVSSCQDEYWGSSCDQWCGHCTDGAPCNKVNGHCDVCQPGYRPPLCKQDCPFYQYGQDCLQRCSTNCANVCDKATGHCTCKPGWKPPNCTERCDSGMYGQDCSTPCGKCYGGVACDHVTGDCVRCQGNYQLPKCTECTFGNYGPNCSLNCSKNCGSVCDPKNGQCTCKPGWMGTTCNQPCPSGRFGEGCMELCGRCYGNASCNNSNGHCFSCQGNYKAPLCKDCRDGYFGISCTQKCSENCTDGACGRGTGNCTCKAGWKPPNCRERCDDGRYGVDCNMTCHENCDSACDKDTGRCTCKPGWRPPACTYKCAGGYYGQDCSRRCGNCTGGSVCRHDTGVCELGCEQGYVGELCQDIKTSSAATDGAVIGGVLGCIFLLILVAVVVIYVRRQCETDKKDDEDDETGRAARTTTRSPDNSRGFHSISGEDDSGLRPRAVIQPESSGRSGPSGPSSSGQVNLGFRDEQPQQRAIFPQFPTPKPQTRVDNEVTITVSSVDPPEASTNDDDSDDSRSTDSDMTGSYDVDSGALSLDKMQRLVLHKLRSGALDSEFEKLPFGLDKPHVVGLKEENRYKNRFATILPYDVTRVVLRDAGPGADDYINASYIKGHWSTRAYISAQAPLDNTVNEWWRMVVQDKITHIVMLTSVAEGRNNKCIEYWPPMGTKRKYGPVDVTGLDVQERADYVIRTFDVRRLGGEASRLVTQYQYVTWPDHSVPSTTALVDFWRTVRTSHRNQTSQSPLVVHCSAGVGRSGTFIGLDIAMDDAENKAEVDLFGIMQRMRKDRCNMIQTKSQYRFLHEAFLEAYTSRDSRLTLPEFDAAFKRNINPSEDNEPIDKEFQALQQMKVLLLKPSTTEAEKEENIGKNRTLQCLPDDRHLVFLRNPVEGRNQYINAVYMPTFLSRRGCILTQLPLTHTIVDMWRLLEENCVTTVVSLGAEVNDEEVRCCYWPRQVAKSLSVGPYTIKLNSKSKLGDHLTTYRLSIQSKSVTDAREVYLLQYTDWTEEVPGDTTGLINLVDMISNQPEENTSSSPIVIQCLDGATKSGLFRAICDVITRMTQDHEVDVYMTARHVHMVRPQSVMSQLQYRYLYHVAQEYKKRNSPYELP